MSTPPDSLEARLARAAQDLDAAAEQYAHKRSPLTGVVSTPRAGRIRRMTGIASVAGIAAVVLLVGSIVRDQRQKGDERLVAMAGAGSKPAVFPFIGELMIPIDANQKYLFQDGTAKKSETERLTIESAVDVDIDSDGTSELALLLREWSDTPDSKGDSKSGIASTIGIYQRSGDSLKLLISTEPVDRIDGIGVRGNTLVIAQQVDGKPNLAAISESVIRESSVDVSAPLRTITVTQLATLEKSSREIRFKVGTASGLVIADPGKRVGWFRAKAGQRLHIDASSVTTGTTRTIEIRKRGASASEGPLALATLPGPLEFVLPSDDEYEVLVGDGDSRVTFELAIDQMGAPTSALYAPTVPPPVPVASIEIPVASTVPGASTVPASSFSIADSSAG
jgi:hypothetical protein